MVRLSGPVTQELLLNGQRNDISEKKDTKLSNENSSRSLCLTIRVDESLV